MNSDDPTRMAAYGNFHGPPADSGSSRGNGANQFPALADYRRWIADPSIPLDLGITDLVITTVCELLRTIDT